MKTPRPNVLVVVSHDPLLKGPVASPFYYQQLKQMREITESVSPWCGMPGV